MAEVIDLKSRGPSAALKKLEWTDKRSSCQHERIEIWPREPIIECADCGVVVDPYYWLRRVCERWRMVEDTAAYRARALKDEADEIKKSLRILRAEYKDESERREAERSLMRLPPRKRG